LRSKAPEQEIFSELPHTFHIPVMGTGFTVDTPLRVARYGISSVVSIGDDFLLEQMRRYHSEQNGLPFEPIDRDSEDARARRITAYLDLLQDLVDRQMAHLRQAPFEPGSEITKFFELLPDSALKQAYYEMVTAPEADLRRELEAALRRRVRAGSIDVNIMTKVDFDVYRKGAKLPAEQSVALSALRGFATSRLNSAVVLSAGMNRRLFSYMAGFDCFYPTAAGQAAKRIILKVSDFRSARLQGKLLAKHGLWVSEYRMESGLNCGGHAFATNGYLMGPILDEFRRNRIALDVELRTIYQAALAARGDEAVAAPPPTRLTAQGGIGTADEDRLMREFYEVDGTGWATPFLLVPEVTAVDNVHLEKLRLAGNDDVELSHASPLGVRFWNLRTSTSETGRRARITEGRPGSSCPKGFLKSNTEFGERPLCPASTTFQNEKLSSLPTKVMAQEQMAAAIESALAKSCLCQNLASGALNKAGIGKELEAAVCCGPNIVNFSKLFSLSQMVDHIYGRLSIINKQDRPHMLIKELSLYVDFLKEELRSNSTGVIERTTKYFADFKSNLLDGIEHYREVASQLRREQRAAFVKDLDALMSEIESCFSELHPALGLCRTA